MTYRIETVQVRGSPMEVFLFAPSGAGPHPGIVLCQHIPVGHAGLANDTVTLKHAGRYAENGYAVAVPFIFHWWPKDADIELKRARFRDDWTRLDLDAAFELLAAQPGVDANRYDNAGHGFQTFTMPERYRPEVSEDVWGKVLAFFAEKLKK